MITQEEHRIISLIAARHNKFYNWYHKETDEKNEQEWLNMAIEDWTILEEIGCDVTHKNFITEVTYKNEIIYSQSWL